MMESTAFFNAKATTSDVSLFLDIDPKRDVIKEFHYDGPHAFSHKAEMEEIKELVLGKDLESVRNLKRSDLYFEKRLSDDHRPVTSVGLWLLREALASYAGESRFYKEERDLICLCFSVTKKDIVKKVLANRDFELKTLIQETMASSACGSCRNPIQSIIDETRSAHGMIKGLDHSKSRYDKDGKWIKVAGMYPGPLLIKLDELKDEWMKREGIVGQFEMELVQIEGFHVSVKVNSTSEKTVSGLLSALTDFLKSRLGVLFFLQSV